jgi:hypothetical protein
MAIDVGLGNDCGEVVGDVAGLLEMKSEVRIRTRGQRHAVFRYIGWRVLFGWLFRVCSRWNY